MKHLGDITAISGYNVPPVDVVIGGSPCQDLSVAGKRAGLSGERSGLFLEQIRIIKEMREADVRRGRTGKFIRPRFMVWENVPGAFSSNKGDDFRSVLEETIRVAEPDAPDVPLPPQGKWQMADCWYGWTWSVAWRVLDAQFWGVPQRRRRVALVADFGGWAAPEILFIRKGVCWDPAESGAPGKEITAGVGGGAAETDGCLTPWDVQSRRIHTDSGAWPALYGGEGGGHGYVARGICAGFKPYAGANAGSIGYEEEKAQTIDTGKPMAVYDARGNGDGKTACTLTGDHQSRVTDYTAIVMATGQANAEILREKAPTLNCDHEQPIVSHTLRGSGHDPQREDMATYPITDGIVRRLTPLECERLQGYPDGWTLIGNPEEVEVKDYEYKYDEDGKEIGKTQIGTHIEIEYFYTGEDGKKKRCADSARYKALGNSIALPPWAWVLKRLCACYERAATMASLFDGIGGFPLIWERLNGPGTCLWASEIEEFPIAVTKRRFGEA